MTEDLSVPNPLLDYDSYEDYSKIYKPQIIEKLFEVTMTDPRMNEQQKIAFFKAFWDLVPQEPTLEDMDMAYKSYIAHFDHISSHFAFVKIIQIIFFLYEFEWLPFPALQLVEISDADNSLL